MTLFSTDASGVIQRILTVGIFLTLAGCDPSAVAADSDNKIDLEDDLAKASYILGYQQALTIQQGTSGVIQLDAFLAGVRAVAQGQPSAVDADTQRIMQAFNDAIIAQQEQATAGARAAGDTFRAEYASREGVTTLPSGLMYEVLAEGDGPKPGLTDTVETHYHGTLIDDTVFDSSVQRGQPASFQVSGVIKGWTEALQLMSVGSKWRLVVPPDLAYGARGAGAKIGPHATLIFEVELLAIK